MFPVTYSEWASPAVHVPKETKDSVRVCGDYKKVNELLEDDGYKLPNVQEMLAKLSEGGNQPQVFSLLNLAGAFQLLLDEESCKLLKLNTHKGLLSTKRLCFGIKTAPSIFQATMDKICYVDDVLIATHNKEDHVKVL